MIPSWIHLSQTAGTAGNTTITITADTNSQLVARLATISVHGTGEYTHLGQNVSITQSGRTVEKVIRYTSTDGNVVMPYTGITVISNTYTPEEGGKITYSGSLETMPNYAFRYCSTLNYIEIPEETTVIGQSAFAGCTSLISITFKGRISQFKNYAFDRCKLRPVDNSFLESATYIGHGAFGDTRFKEGITLGSGCTFFGGYNIDGSFYEADNFHRIICKALTPPEYEAYSFRRYGMGASGLTFWTPCGCDYSTWWNDTSTVFGPGYCLDDGAHKDEFAFENYHVWFDKTDENYWYLKISCMDNPIPLSVTLYWRDFDRGGGEIMTYTWTIPAGEGINSVITNISVQDFDAGYGNVKLLQLNIEGESGEYSLNGNHYFLDVDDCYDSIGDALDEVNNEWGLTEIDHFGDRIIEEGQL